jgi:hypothetical protein
MCQRAAQIKGSEAPSPRDCLDLGTRAGRAEQAAVETGAQPAAGRTVSTARHIYQDPTDR